MPKSREQQIEQDIGDYSALDSLKNSPAGVVLTSALADQIITTVDLMTQSYKKATRDDLVGYCASISEKIILIRALNRAAKNKDLAEEALKRVLVEEGS